MAFNTQEQEIIKFGATNGKSRAEVEQAIANYRSGVVPTPKVTQPDQSSSIVDGLSRVATTYGNNLKEQALGGVQNAQKTIGMGVDTMQQAQQIPLDTSANKDRALLTGAAGAAQIGAGAMSGTIQTVFSPLTALVQTGIQGLSELDQATGGNMKNQIAQVAQSNPELIKSISDYVVQNPKKVQFASDMLNILTAGVGGKVAGEAGKDLTKGVTTGIKDTLGGTPKSIDGIPVATMADEALHSGLQLKNDIQLSIAKKNVSPQLESSAGRLMSDTVKNVENPVVAYDKYLAQSKKSLGDIKVDAPISTVGGKIGDAFMKVVKQKQAVGATLGDELKSVGKLKVSVVQPKGTLLSELNDSGLSYNPRTNELTSFQGSKFAPEEVSMLNQYVKDVQKLGDTPSVSQIDNFISKTRSDLNFAKGKSGVTGTTNAERIIKGNLTGMRDSLNPSKNGLPQLSKYWNANKAYSELSDFVDEGAGFLGKTTQSGDFAKDASVAKSSVQSILNGGKKDWLIKLEGLTGYPALDESVLALQAMKDAGDFKGLSLLQAMQESGGIPTTKAGFTQKILDMAIAKGEKLIVGTPEEQTRALLQDLSVKNSTKASTPTINSSASPTGGTKIQSSKITNPSDIPAQSTPTTLKSKGIRGMMNFDEIINSVIPTKKLLTESKDSLSQLESAISFVKEAKSPQAIIDFRKDLSKVMTSMGRDTVITDSNYKKIIQEADDMVSQLRGHIKKSESQSASSIINREFDTKKKVSSLEQEAKKYKSAEEFVKANKNKDVFFRGVGKNIGAKASEAFDDVGGVYTTSKPETASTFGDIIVAYKPTAKTKLIRDMSGESMRVRTGFNDLPEVPSSFHVLSGKEKTEWLKKNGYDGLVQNLSGREDLVILNEKSFEKVDLK